MYGSVSSVAWYPIIFQRTSGKAIKYIVGESGKYVVEMEDGGSIRIEATSLVKVMDGFTDSGDESSDEDDGEVRGVGECEEELASEVESETEEPAMIKDETEEQAARRIKNERAGKIMFVSAKRLKEGVTYRKKVIDAAKLGHRPAQVAAWKICQEHTSEFSEEDAQHWLTTAAERGDADSQERLGFKLLGNGFKPTGDVDFSDEDYKACYPWLLRAAKQGNKIQVMRYRILAPWFGNGGHHPRISVNFHHRWYTSTTQATITRKQTSLFCTSIIAELMLV